ncbi:MAG: hypothetical protein AAGA30_11180, partial [Planctomycetota bacterium]
MATANGPGVEERPSQRRERQHREARIEQVRQRASHDKTITEFQPDAVEVEHRKVPGGARWTLYTVSLLITCFVLWSYWAQVDQIVIGSGQLITTENAVVVQSFSSAPIHSLEVKFGDRVQAGQLVATLDSTFSEADLSQLLARQNSAKAILSRLRAELDDGPFDLQQNANDPDWDTQAILFRERKREFVAELEKFDSEIAKLNIQVEDTEKNQSEFQKDRLSALQDIFKKQKDLFDKGSASKIDVESARLNMKDAEKELEAFGNRIRELNA